MGIGFRVAPPLRAARSDACAGRPIRLSGRVLGQLSAAEQLVVWALRETRSTDPGAAERLVSGFRLAFDPRLIGAAACGFDGLRRCLTADPNLAPRLCPLHCACLGVDEERLLNGLAAAQLGDRARHDGELARFVPSAAALQLWRQSRLFGSAMSGAGLVLKDSRLVALETNGTPH
jgi:hypothetical protein